MINHARTLLLNRSGATRPAPDFFLEEYVDPAYRPIPLSSLLSAFQRALIGAADDAYANYRLWQYLGILHATEFESYVLELDPRVTYRHERSIVNSAFGTSYVELNAEAGGLELFFSGAPKPVEPPRLMHDWMLELSPGPVLRSTDLRNGLVREDALSLTDGLTGLMPLAGQEEFLVRLRGTTLTVDARWTVSHLLQPVDELSDLLLPLDNLADQFSATLFGAQEPYRTFGQLWDKHAYIQYRMSGILLAYIYRAEEARLNG
jgi:hypothetical protein